MAMRRGQYRPAAPAKMSGRDRGAALLGAHRADRPRRGAARRGAARRACPARASGSARCSGCCSSTWLVWLGGSSTLVPVRHRQRRAAGSRSSARSGCSPGCAAGRDAARSRAASRAAGSRAGAGAGSPRACRRSPTRCARRLFWGAEAVFLVAFAAMALLVAYSPDVWNTEKPMDMAFLNAANRADTFPPQDPWLAGADLNYYYLGHLAMAVLVRAHRGRARPGLQPRRRGAVRADRRGGVHDRRRRCGRRRAAQRGGGAAPGLAAVALVLVAGNLEGARLLIADGGPLRDYDWFAASRVIDDTINEFPWFSFLLGDLHAHVLALPFTLLALAFALQVVLAGPRLAPRARALLEGGGAALAVGFLYAVNSWSYPVMAGLLALARGRLAARPAQRAARARPRCAGCSPCWRRARCSCCRSTSSFDPAARGIGVVDEGRGLRRLAARRAAAVRLARRARRARLRRAGCWRPGARAATRPGSRSRRVFAGSLLAALEYAHVALLAAALLASRCGALLSARVDAGRSGSSGCSSPAASRACSGPSCSTCATSSTAARCTA